jgi:hypothetical protein
MAWTSVYAFRSVGLCFNKSGRLHCSVCIMTTASIIKLSILRGPVNKVMWVKNTRLFWLQIASHSCVPKHFFQASLVALAVCTGRKFC